MKRAVSHNLDLILIGLGIGAAGWACYLMIG